MKFINNVLYKILNNLFYEFEKFFESRSLKMGDGDREDYNSFFVYLSLDKQMSRGHYEPYSLGYVPSSEKKVSVTKKERNGLISKLRFLMFERRFY